MKYEAKLAHHVPGRLRVKIPAAIGDNGVLESLKQVFAGVGGVDSVVVKPLSGSLILQYDPKRNAEMKSRFASWQHEQITLCGGRPGDEVEEIAQKIQVEAEFLASHSQAARAVVDLFKNIDLDIRTSTGNAVDLKTAVVAGLAVAALIGLGIEASTPMWVTLALFVLNHFLEQFAALHPVGIR
jgi:hypothetical protein